MSPVDSVVRLDAVAKGVSDEELEALSHVPVGRKVHRGPSVFVLIPGNNVSKKHGLKQRCSLHITLNNPDSIEESFGPPPGRRISMPCGPSRCSPSH